MRESVSPEIRLPSTLDDFPQLALSFVVACLRFEVAFVIGRRCDPPKLVHVPASHSATEGPHKSR